MNNTANEEEGEDQEDENDLFDYIRAKTNTSDDDDPVIKRLEEDTVTAGNKALESYKGVIKICGPKEKEKVNKSKLPIVLNYYRNHFDSLLRSPDPIEEDGEIYVVREYIIL